MTRIEVERTEVRGSREAFGEAEGVVHAGAAGSGFEGEGCGGEVGWAGEKTPFWLEREESESNSVNIVRNDDVVLVKGYWGVSERRKVARMMIHSNTEVSGHISLNRRKKTR